MHILATQKELATAQKLTLCYLCGNALVEKDGITRDHVPPKTVFAKQHRGNPLILPTHLTCNNSQSNNDEIVGQLTSVLHGNYPRPNRMRLRLRDALPLQGGQPKQVLHGPNLVPLVWRWTRAFHAALYREHLPIDTTKCIHPPLPSGHLLKGVVVADKEHPRQRVFVSELKKNRVSKTIDRIQAWCGKFVYESVWVRTDQGYWMCIFGLRIYDWETLGDADHHQRGCVGCYFPKAGRPPDATIGTSLEFPIAQGNPLDAFG